MSKNRLGMQSLLNSIDINQLELNEAFNYRDELLADKKVENIGIVDTNGIIQYINPALNLLLNFNSNDIEGKSIFEIIKYFIHPNDQEHTKLAIIKCIKTPSSEKIQSRIKNKDGIDLWKEFILYPILGDNDNVNGLFYGTHDITEKKLQEKEKLISQEHFKNIFYQSPIATAIISMDKKIINVNQQFCLLTGYSQEDFQSSSILDIIHPEDILNNKENMKNLINGHIKQHQAEKRYIHNNGKIIWVKVALKLIHDKLGHPIHFICSIQEINRKTRP